jgi:hypothetical protein
MKRIVIACVVAAIVLAVPAVLWGKGHVPAHKSQFCHGGQVIEVGTAASGAHLGHGDAPVPADDPDCIKFKGDPCDVADPCGS